MKAKLLFCSFILSIVFVKQTYAWANHGLVERVYITGESLKNNFVHEDSGQEALVYVPRGYYENKDKRYPVLYVLHGFGGNAISWFRDNDTMPEPNLRPILDKMISSNEFPEAIVVVSDFNTRHLAGWYQNSPISGNWRDFFIRDVIGFIDTKFRTIADGESRVLLGQSMGGYGAIDIALDSPELFTAVAALSPANLLLRSLSPFEFAYFHQAVKPSIASYTGLKSQLSYATHLFMALSQIVVAEPNNSPTFIKSDFSFSDYQAISDLSLEAQMQHEHVLQNDYSHIEIRTEIGLGEGVRAVANFGYVNQELTKLGFQVSSHLFNGGHDDKLRENIKDSLIFLGNELK